MSFVSFVSKLLEFERSAELQRPRIGERRAVAERRTRREGHRPEGIAVECVQQVDAGSQFLRLELEDLREAQVCGCPGRPDIGARRPTDAA